MTPNPIKLVQQPRAGRPIGGRVAVVYSARYQIHLAGFEKLHPFDIHKYARIYRQLVADGVLQPADVFVPTPVRREQLLRVHTPGYLATLRDPARVAEYLEAGPIAVLPAKVVHAGILTPFRTAVGGTILAGRLAMDYGIAINLGGGYHHAKPDSGEGFCIYADIPIAVRILQDERRIRRALVVDLDVHQGNGTAACLADDDEVFCFSMHQEGIYPQPRTPGDLDVELPAGTGDDAFLRILAEYLPRLIEQTQPDVIFLQAGADTLRGDPLAGLAMSEAGIVQRDAYVIEQARRKNIPVVMTLGGGYSRNAWHAQYRSIRHIITRYGIDPDGGPARGHSLPQARPHRQQA